MLLPFAIRDDSSIERGDTLLQCHQLERGRIYKRPQSGMGYCKKSDVKVTAVGGIAAAAGVSFAFFFHFHIK